MEKHQILATILIAIAVSCAFGLWKIVTKAYNDAKNDPIDWKKALINNTKNPHYHDRPRKTKRAL